MSQATQDPDVEKIAVSLADAGLLSERQAEVYVRRDLLGQTREATAAAMDVTPNVHDNYLRAARDKIQAASSTLDKIQAMQQVANQPPDDVDEDRDDLELVDDDQGDDDPDE